MTVSQNRGTQYRPPNTIVLIKGTPKEVPQNFVKPPSGSPWYLAASDPDREDAVAEVTANVRRREVQAEGVAHLRAVPRRMCWPPMIQTFHM